MARLRYNGLTATLGAAMDATQASITFAAALTHSGGTAVPTITGSDYIPLTILATSDPDSAVSEIVYLTAYTSGATTGTITRGQESTTGVTHASGDGVVHGLTVADITALLAAGGTGDPAWIAPTFLDTWVNFGGAYANAGYRKDGQGIVHLRGMVKNGAIGSDIFVLPVGYRPSADLLMPVDSNVRPGNIIVRSTGQVVHNTGGNTYYSLDGTQFFAV